MTRIDRRSGHVTVNGSELSYEVAGTGRPVVLLHSGVADSRMWDRQLETLAHDYSVLRLDFRGFGRTRTAPGAFSNFDDVAAVMDAAGFENAAIIGLSFGAKVAIDFCLAHPDRVAALVVSSPIASGFEAPPDLAAFGEAEDEAIERGDLDAAVELNLRTWVDGRHNDPSVVDPSMRAWVGDRQREIFESDAQAPDGIVVRQLDPPAAGRLGEITVPTLVISGTFDIEAFVDFGERVAAGIPNARLATLPTAHLTSLEAPEEFDAAVLAFFSECYPPNR